MAKKTPISDASRSDGIPKEDLSLRRPAFSSDRPLDEAAQDRLGFRAVATRLADSLLSQSPQEGYVVAIEGAWGSGKSTLVNFVSQELTSGATNSPEVVRFEPWIVGNKHGMLIELMSDISRAVDHIASETTDHDNITAEKVRSIGESIRKYTSKLGRAGAPVAKIAGALGVPWATTIGDVIEGLAGAAEAVDLSEPVDTLKAKLIEGLSQLNRKIVVLIDDLDRLEPLEAAEVLRLIRAVADFPNILYILSFDEQVLAKSLKSALQIADGNAFLQKIIQVSFKVPRPESFDLRQWFEGECLTLYSSILKKPLDGDRRTRLQEVCGLEGGFLETPRDVIRALNAIRLYWPSVAGEVDYPDMVWLQLIRLQNEGLYRWIEKYMTDYFAVAGGAAVDKAGRIEDAAALKKHMTSESLTSARSLWILRDLIPGLQGGGNVDEEKLLYNAQTESEIAKSEGDFRLSSSQHHRFYFAFSKPAGALDEQEFLEIVRQASAGKSIDRECDDLIKRRRPQGGTMMRVFIDRLNAVADERLDVKAIPSILKSLSNCMDHLARAESYKKWGVNWDWVAARQLVKRLILRLRADTRAATLKAMFSKGRAIGWLMVELIRNEAFSHGLQGNSPKPQEEWLLTVDELRDAIGLMNARFSKKDRKYIIQAPELLRVLYAWQETSDGKDLRKWIRECSKSDDTFVKVLSGCRGWMQSDKTYYPLNKRDLKNFLNYDDAIGRLEGIAKRQGSSSLGQLAKELLDAASIGRDD